MGDGAPAWPMAAAIRHLADLARMEGEHHAARRLDDLVGQSTPDPFHVVVTGPAGSGKSTLIGAFLGIRDWPTIVSRLPRAPTVITPGGTLTGTILFQDGHREQVAWPPLDAAAWRWRSHSGRSGILHCVLTVPAPPKLLGLSLIELPTDGALGTDAAAYLLDADVVLFVRSAEPLTSSELALLRALRLTVGRVFLVQNRRDLYGDEDWWKALAANQAAATSVAPGITIYSLSATHAMAAQCAGDAPGVTQSGWRALEQALFTSLEENRHTVNVHASVATVESLVAQVTDGVCVRRACLKYARQELQARRDLLASRRAEIQEEAWRHVQDSFQQNLAQAIAASEARLETWARHLRVLLEEATAADDGHSREQKRAQQMTTVIKHQTQEFLAAEHLHWQNWWREEAERLTTSTGRLTANLYGAYQALLNVRWDTTRTLDAPRVGVPRLAMSASRFKESCRWSCLTSVLPPKAAQRRWSQQVDACLIHLVAHLRRHLNTTVVREVRWAKGTLLFHLAWECDQLDALLWRAVTRALEESGETQGHTTHLEVLEAWAEEWATAVGHFRRLVSGGRSSSVEVPGRGRP
jgi:energy-coupling factor transporter ATP-binding protein EcfA2